MHFRIRHYTDSRDGDALIVRVDWECFCGQENEPHESHCAWCKSPRGSWLCERCGHMNPQTATACEHCGRGKESD